ncbi:hypothetical protein GW17_00050812 [Ensete ventricosum]|nr:hypothetical protein GW17_00050812 [Ensete ventricosum]
MSQSEGGSQAHLHGIERRVFDPGFRSAPRRLSYQVVVAATVLGDVGYNPLRGPLTTPQAFSCAIRCTPSAVLGAGRRVGFPDYPCQGHVGIRRVSDLEAS